jgi:hypothetical protein
VLFYYYDIHWCALKLPCAEQALLHTIGLRVGVTDILKFWGVGELRGLNWKRNFSKAIHGGYDTKINPLFYTHRPHFRVCSYGICNKDEHCGWLTL